MSGYVDTIQDRDGTDYYLKATIPSVQSTAESVAATDPVSVDVDVDSDGVVSFDFHIPAASTANADAAAQEARDAADACEAATSAANTAATGATTAAQNAVNATVDTVHAAQDARTAIVDTQAATASANAAASAANTAKDATIAATTAANEATTAATTATSNANTATANANAATTAANAAATRANASADAADTATDDANAAAARAEEAARPTEEMFASVHELLRAGSADAVTGSGDTVSATFLQRASNVEGARDGVATIECVRGNTVGWNQLESIVNGTDTKNGVTAVKSNAAGTVTLNGEADNADTNFHVTGAITLDPSHKYLFKGCPKGGSTTTYYMSNAYSVNGVYYDTGNGTIFTPINSTSIGLLFMVRIWSLPGYTANNLVFRPQLFDLTQMFGAGNEPATVEEFERLYPLPYYPYDAGTLKPVNMTGIESTSYNLLDPEKIAALNGVTQLGDTFTADMGLMRAAMVEGWEDIDYIPGMAYEISYEVVSNSGSAVRFDVTYTDGTVQSPSAMVGKRTHIVDASHTIKQIQLNYGSGGTLVFKDFCICIANSTRNGEYEPHWDQLREIDLATYFPDGMYGAGNAADALYSDHADKNMGVMDLGGLTWTYNQDTQLFWANSLRVKPGGNIKCLKYETSHSGGIGAIPDKSIWNQKHGYSANNIIVHDSAYDDAAAFKTAMSGVMMVYECTDAYRSTVPIDPPLNLSYRVDTYGTESIVTPTDTISAPPTLDITYGYTAESLRDEALAVIAPVENHRAQTNHAVGSYVIHDATLYKVTRAIAANEEFTPGTNVTATTVMAEIAAING